MKPKTPIYFVPGTAANSKIFERMQFPESQFELIFLEWFLPTHKEETIQAYAKRMCQLIQHENPILIGVSFGGILVQEMSKIIDCKKVIIISSIKNRYELSKRLRFVKFIKAYKLFPSNSIDRIEKLIAFIYGKKAKKRIDAYQMYLSVRDPLFLDWATKNVLLWDQEESIPGIIHIHGDKDPIFPLKRIKNAIVIKNGSHVMVVTKGKKISEIIVKKLAEA